MTLWFSVVPYFSSIITTKNHKAMTEQMTQTVKDRINEMTQDAQVQQIMLGFETEEQAQEWIIKANRS